MSLDIKLIEAQLALDLIASADMPKIAWDALEAGFDGPAIRRLAALEHPTYFEVADVLPLVRQELGLSHIANKEAGTRIANHSVQKLLDSADDPLKHVREFEHLWQLAGYPDDIAVLGTLHDDVYIAQTDGVSESKIRAWVTSVLSDFVRLHDEGRS